MGDVRIRPARPEDLDPLAEAHFASFRAGNGPHLPPEQMALYTLERDRGAWEPVVRERPPRAALLVLETDEGLLGVAGAGRTRDDDLDRERVGELYALYVHPDSWGAGHGGALHDAAMDHLAREGFGEAVLWVLEGNERARRFYERRGWRADSSRGDFWAATRVRLRRSPRRGRS